MNVKILLFTALSICMTYIPVAIGASSDSETDPDQAYQDAKRLLYKQKYKRALDELDVVLEDNENNADAWNLVGFASRKLGKLVDAERAYKKALSINPEHLGALEYQGELLIMQDNLDDARANLAKLEKLCTSCQEHSDLAAAIMAAE